MKIWHQDRWVGRIIWTQQSTIKELARAISSIEVGETQKPVQFKSWNECKERHKDSKEWKGNKG